MADELQHHAAFPAFRAMPLAQEQVDFLFAPDERRERRPMQPGRLFNMLVSGSFLFYGKAK
jgi:hypothetical protein